MYLFIINKLKSISDYWFIYKKGSTHQYKQNVLFTTEISELVFECSPRPPYSVIETVFCVPARAAAGKTLARKSQNKVCLIIQVSLLFSVNIEVLGA